MADFPGLQISMTIPARQPSAPVRLLAAGAIAQAVDAFARLAHREAGIALQLQFGNGTKVVRRVQAGEAFDVLIAAPTGIDAASTLGRLVADTITPVGRVGIGAVVPASLPAPDVSTVDTLRQAILAADTIVYNTATSGTYVHEMLAAIGVRDAICAKIVRGPNGPSVMQHVAAATDCALGFGAITEIRLWESQGVKLAGALPDELRPYTVYSAAIMVGAENEALARTLLGLIASPAGRAAFASGGVG